MRHLQYMVSTGAGDYAPAASAYAVANAASILAHDVCAASGRFGLNWEGPCGAVQDTMTETSAMDALVAAAMLGGAPAPPAGSWEAIGLGNCADGKNASMPNCGRRGVASEAACGAAAAGDAAALAYDWSRACDGSTFCRVRTTGGAGACGSGWAYEDGVATSVTTTTGSSLTVCVVRK